MAENTNTMWRLTVLDRNGEATKDVRMGWIDKIYPSITVTIETDDVLEDNNADLKGLKGKVVQAQIPLDDGSECQFVGKVTEIDRDGGLVEIEREE